MANEIYTYRISPTFSMDFLADGVENIMRQAGCTTQNIILSDTNIVVQCKNDEGGGKILRKLSGTAKALSVSLSVNNDILTVQVGNTQWADKAIGYAISWFVFWPTIITASYGIAQQNALKRNILNYIESICRNS